MNNANLLPSGTIVLPQSNTVSDINVCLADRRDVLFLVVVSGIPAVGIGLKKPVIVVDVALH